jgi:hypothetical protein
MTILTGLVFDRKDFVYDLIESGAHSGWSYKELAIKSDEELKQLWMTDLQSEYSMWCD